MNHETKNKLLTWLVVLLIIVNAATLAFFWLNRPKYPQQFKGSPQEFLVTALKLNSSQQQQYEVLVKAHHEEADQLREKIKIAKESFFDLLKQKEVSDSLKQAMANRASMITEELDIMTLNHFQKVRALCNVDQQKKFDEIIQQVTDMIGHPRQPGGPGKGPQGPPPLSGEPEGKRPPSPAEQ